MAAPADITLQNLSGIYVMNRTLSSDTDSVLALQGIGWLTRKAISVATVTIEVNQSVVPNPDDPSNAPVHLIVVNQTATGGIKTTESRYTDWRERPHTDRVFGALDGQSRLIRGSKSADGKVRPDLDLQVDVKDDKIVKHLKGEIDMEGNSDEGFIVDEIENPKDGVAFGEGEGLWLHNHVKHQQGTWSAEQIWGFETINGQRYHTRRLVVVDKDGKYLVGRLVYDYQGPISQ